MISHDDGVSEEC